MTGYRYLADTIHTLTITNRESGETEFKVNGEKISKITDREVSRQ